MPLEIERKFLLSTDSWKAAATTGIELAQAYILQRHGKTVRIRIADEKAFLTVKGATSGISRLEFEYAIPIAEAREMLALCEGGLIQKTRHRIEHAGHLWEIDVFHGDNEGLVVAEIELAHPDEKFESPSWLGAEISNDLRYSNVQLSLNPFRLWIHP